jgi:adenylosuccinate lyase
MGRIWSEEPKYQTWLRVELAVCEAYARRGRIPADAMARIRAKRRVDIARILAIQERVKHEMIALLTSLERAARRATRASSTSASPPASLGHGHRAAAARTPSIC